MPETSNPYIAGSPVTGPEMFFGRDDIFNFVRQALTGQHRDNVLVLYGQRRTGKTSVLYQMSRQLGERYVCIFIDLHGLALDGLNGFLWELASHIHRALRRDFQINLPALDRAAFQDDPRTAFEITFLDSVWAEIGDRHLLLMLDEAIRLEEQVKAGKLEVQVFEYLRHLMQHHPRLNFLFSLGSGLEEMQKEYAFLFNVALYKKISFLDRASAEALITEPAKDSCLFQPAAVERILEVTSGHPYFTQLICHSLFNRCRDVGGVSLGDVDMVLDEAVERGLAVLKHVWEESTPGEKAVLAGLASASAAPGAENLPPPSPTSGSLIRPWQASSAEIIQIWAERGVPIPESEAARAVRNLMARDVITGDKAYSFTVDLMRLWVQKFRRLEWVKEEIEDAALGWSQREQERVLVDQQQHNGEVQTQIGEALLQARQVRQNSFRLLILAILALTGLLSIGYFASGLLERRAPATVPPENFVEPLAGAAQPVLSGDAALVSDLAVLGDYVWAATEGGLVRWSADGTYRLYPGSGLGFPDDCINTIVARPTDNTLWLGCGGVAAARLEGDKLAALGHYDRDNGLGMGTVQDLAMDGNGAIWAGGSPDEGRPPPLSIFLGVSEDEPWVYPEDLIDDLSQYQQDFSPAGIDIRSIYVTSDNTVLLGLKEDGILYLEDGTVLHFGEAEGAVQPDLKDSRIRRLLVDKNGTIWAAASEHGLLRLTDADQPWESVAAIPAGTPVRTIAEFLDGSLWAGGDNIVWRSDDGGATWTQVGSEQGLGDDIGGLVQDKNGNVWAGSFGGGVSVWDGQSWRSRQR